MIVGMGLDIAPIGRVARLVRDHAAALDRIFTPHERAFCEAGGPRRRPARYAAAFAAKEAVMKALGTGWRSDVEWSDIETRPPDTVGGPGNVVLRGAIGKVAERQGAARITVSVAATRDTAMATVLVEQIEGEPIGVEHLDRGPRPANGSAAGAGTERGRDA